uniref:Uncharacterized protein n=1 Tax=Amphimedon queenslandica TaxID=400682 RepID=A0A1X7UXR3_AMPQE
MTKKKYSTEKRARGCSICSIMLRSVLNRTKDRPHFDVDNSVAVVKTSSIISNSNVVVEVYEVKAGSKYYSAKIHEIGNEDTIARVEGAFKTAKDEEEEPESTGTACGSSVTK